MKRLLAAFLVLCFQFTFKSYSNTNPSEYFNYYDPTAGSNYINPESGIILKPDGNLDRSSLSLPNAIKIHGSISGECNFLIINSSDGNTIILKPTRKFTTGENVTVEFTALIKKTSGVPIKPFSYGFTISKSKQAIEPLEGLKNELTSEQYKKLNSFNPDFPVDFPQITITTSNSPAPGFLFLSNIVFNTSIPNTNYLLILQNNAVPVFSREMPYRVFDFDKQPNGNLTYFDQSTQKFYELNTSYQIIDSFYTGNGYVTDLHELRLLLNGHALLMSYDKQIVNMSLLVAGGDTAANVTGLVLQEIDENKNVVFQWRSWDHFLITDATHENLLTHEIDYVHGNAIEIDPDGNLLLSSRHMDEITKINRTTGNIIWRLGGKNNQFVFTNDNTGFSHQHGIRRLANGNIIMFDNGNYHAPPFSRAVEYAINESNLTATLVWQYRSQPDHYGNAMGFAQRLSNGNTLVSWGSTNPTLTEVKPDGTKALELSFSSGVFTYRAFKYEWNMVSIDPQHNSLPENYSLGQNYPNPFNPSTNIGFSIPEKSFVNVSLFDALGRKVRTITNEEYLPGFYNINFAAEGLASGTYFYKITAGNFSQAKKMILIK